MDYPLSIEVKQKEFSVIEGDINDLEKDFSGEILSTVVDGKNLEFLRIVGFIAIEVVM